MAINRDVVARWIPSLTPDIVAQKVVWKLNGATVVDRLIARRLNRRSFAKDIPSIRLQEGDKVNFSVCSVDEFGQSSEISAEVQFVITPPDPPTNLTLQEKIKYRRIP
jgi:hypothetical protein